MVRLQAQPSVFFGLTIRNYNTPGRLVLVLGLDVRDVGQVGFARCLNEQHHWNAGASTKEYSPGLSVLGRLSWAYTDRDWHQSWESSTLLPPTLKSAEVTSDTKAEIARLYRGLFERLHSTLTPTHVLCVRGDQAIEQPAKLELRIRISPLRPTPGQNSRPKIKPRDTLAVEPVYPRPAAACDHVADACRSAARAGCLLPGTSGASRSRQS